MTANNRSVKILSPPLLTTLYLTGVIVILAIIWAFKAKIPLTVSGTGVLLPIGEIFTFSSNGSGKGYLFYLYDRTEDKWHQQTYEFIQNPAQLSDAEMVIFATNIINQVNSIAMTNSQETSDTLLKEEVLMISRGIKLKRGKLIAYIDSQPMREKLRTQLLKLKDIAAASNRAIARTNNLISISENELLQRQQYLSDMKSLETKNAITRTTVLQELSNIDQLKTKILELKQKKDTTIQALVDEYGTTRGDLSEFIDNSFVFAHTDGYIDQILALEGDRVTANQELIKYSRKKLSPPTIIPVYVGIKEAARIYPGMSLLATPLGFKRSEVGGIKGKVLGKSLLPSAIESIEIQTGNKILAEDIAKKESTPVLVVVSLERKSQKSEKNQGGYNWSSNANLPFPPSTSDELNIEITTRSVTPVEMIIPIFRELIGQAPPDPIKTQSTE